MLSTVAGRFTTQKQFNDYEAFLEKEKTALGDLHASLVTAKEAANSNLEWDKKYLKEFIDHLKEIKKNSASVKVISILVSIISLAVLFVFN